MAKDGSVVLMLGCPPPWLDSKAAHAGSPGLWGPGVVRTGEAPETLRAIVVPLDGLSRDRALATVRATSRGVRGDTRVLVTASPATAGLVARLYVAGFRDCVPWRTSLAAALRLPARADPYWSPLARPRLDSSPLGATALALLAEGLFRTSLCQLAARLRVSERTLRRHVREAAGKAFRRLVRDGRLELAAHLLVVRIPVARVAEVLGYGSTSALGYAVRHATGRTPGDWAASLESPCVSLRDASAGAESVLPKDAPWQLLHGRVPAVHATAVMSAIVPASPRAELRHQALDRLDELAHVQQVLDDVGGRSGREPSLAGIGRVQRGHDDDRDG